MATRNIEVRMPLFDRLVDRQSRLGRELRPVRTLDRRGVRESVRREVEQLLNTRCPFPASSLADRPRSVIDYGIPDFTMMTARSFPDRQTLAETLRAAIEAFEPRLIDVRVSLEPVPGDEMSLSGSIEASIMIDKVAEPLSFVTVLQLKEGRVEIQ